MVICFSLYNSEVPQANLFITCILDTIYPRACEAVVKVLERVGVQVSIPQGQTCCGQPAFNAGMRLEARTVAEHTVKVLEKSPGDIVVPSGSCAGMIKHQYPVLFADDPKWLPRAQEISARTYEFSEYLVDILGIADVGARFPGKITYHSSCHLLREMGIDRQPRLLLANVREAEFVELSGTQECCGFGGVFSVEHPEVSAEMLKRKIANFQSTQAPVVVSCDSGCITHINGGLNRLGLPQRAIYIAEVLNSR